MKKRIAIIAGGDSSEVVVSLKSAEGIYSFLDKERYEVYIAIIKRDGWYVNLPGGEKAVIDKNGFNFKEGGVTKHFDFAYITIHGTPGEDGLLQGYFELIGMPYSSCNALVSALTFNKFFCNNYLRNFGINVAGSVRIRKGDCVDGAGLVARLGLPLFVKPNTGGSSFGITKVKEAFQLLPSIEKAFAEGSEVIIEQAVEGMEVTSGCYKVEGKEVIFPITEVVSQNEIFDFDAKYNGQSEEITPARIPEALADQVKQTTSLVYDLLGAKGLIRIDYIITSAGKPVVLDVNTTPGMTGTSFIPQQVEAAGLTMKNVLADIIENELKTL